MACNLLRQYKAWSWVPFRLLVPQGTEKASSAYHAGKRPRDRDCDPVMYSQIFDIHIYQKNMNLLYYKIEVVYPDTEFEPEN